MYEYKSSRSLPKWKPPSKFLKTLTGKISFSKFRAAKAIDHVEAKIQIPPYWLRLILAWKQLEDERTHLDFNIQKVRLWSFFEPWVLATVLNEICFIYSALLFISIIRLRGGRIIGYTKWTMNFILGQLEKRAQSRILFCCYCAEEDMFVPNTDFHSTLSTEIIYLQLIFNEWNICVRSCSSV